MTNPQPASDRIVAFDDFLEHVVFRALSKNPQTVSNKALQKLLDILATISFERDGVKYIERDNAANFLQNFLLALKENDGRFLFVKRGLRVKNIVDVEEFVKSREYMDLGMSIRPKLMELLWNLFHGEGSDNYLEVALGGAIGWGKSFFAEVATAYILYRLSCYHSPQLEYKLAPGSQIVFTMQSLRLEQAKKILFQPFMERIRRSPYFQRNFPFDPTITTELRFPNNILVLPLSSSDTAALGYNVYSAILDELNFLAFVEDSVRAKGTDEVYDQASKLYMTTLRRVRSRFQVAGKAPGKIFLISSANYPDDFMDRKFKEAQAQLDSGKKPTIFPIRLARWEVFPPGTFSSETFLVEVGDAVKKSRVLSNRNEAVDPNDIIEVPIDFKDDFMHDLEAAIRDVAGIPVGGVNSFIKQREKIADAAKRHKEIFGETQLFSTDRVDISRYSTRLYGLLDLQYLSLLHDKEKPFAVHVDIGLSRDSCGLAVSHIEGVTEVGRSFNWDEKTRRYVEVQGGQAPAFVVDGVIEIINAPGDEVDIGLVGDLILTIASHINVTWVTADRFQSAALLQRMRKARNAFGKKIRTALISVDASLAPYMGLKQAIRDERIIIPPVAKLLRELRELELDPKRGKVDHPTGGSKDLADAVAGSAYVLSQMAATRSSIRDVTSEDRNEAESTESNKIRIRRIHV